MVVIIQHLCCWSACNLLSAETDPVHKQTCQHHQVVIILACFSSAESGAQVDAAFECQDSVGSLEGCRS